MFHLYSFLILLSAFFVQASVVGNLRIFGLVPDFLLVLIVYFSFFKSIKNTIFLALFFGFLMDIYFGPFFGFYTATFFLASWGANALSRDGKSLSVLKILFWIGFLSFAQSFFIALDVYLNKESLSVIIIAYLFLQIGVNVLLGLIVFKPLERFFEMLSRVESVSKQRFKI